MKMNNTNLIMKKILLTVIILLLIENIKAQNTGDTIIVQTFDYSMTYGQAWGPPRDTIAYFPTDTNLTFEKIIMSYSMRCKDGQINTSGGNNVACGEWDYSCHTYIHDSSRIDSLKLKTYSHSITGFNGSVYDYSLDTVYNYFYSIDSLGIINLDSIALSPDTIYEFAIISNSNTLMNDVVDTISTNYYWQPFSYTYDTSGNIINIDTLFISGSISISELVYYNRYPMAFQIMSFVTPYGIGLDLGPEGKTWYFDLTDYSPVFKGPKRITVSSGGQWQEDMDIKFYFIVGTPPRNVIDMQQIWRPQSKGYSSIMNDDFFEPRNVKLNSNATSFKLKSVITGHGQQGEFIPRDHYLNIDGGPQEYVWSVWTECAENPVYPQGGTWIYDRAGWCPGEPSDVKEEDITSLVNPGQIHNIDYGITTASGSSNYWVSNQLVSYSDPNFSLDASVTDVISPSKKVRYARYNPTCGNPKIKIKNTGSADLTSLKIEYWINNATNKEVYMWTGNLGFLEEEVVELTGGLNLWSNTTNSENTFYVEISNPNGGSDNYNFNNFISSDFDLTPKYPNTFALWFETNSGGGFVSESSWEFIDNSNNTIVYQSPVGGLFTNTQYRDTLIFNEGCYSFIIRDSDDDGIDFWANNDGSGMARFREIGASWLKAFEGDFGRFMYHEFRIENEASSINDESIKNWIIYPNPSSNIINIKGFGNDLIKIRLYDNLGKLKFSENVDAIGIVNKDVDVSNLNAGLYFLEIESHNSKFRKKIIKK